MWIVKNINIEYIIDKDHKIHHLFNLKCFASY